MTDDSHQPDAEDRSDALVHAVGLYALGEVNEGKAAEIADSTRWEMREILTNAGLELRHGPQTVEGVREDAGLIPADVADRSDEDNHQQAVEACQHAADVFRERGENMNEPSNPSTESGDQPDADTKNPVNWLILTFPTGERFGVPARIVAEHRAAHDADERPLADWARNNMDWDGLRHHAERLDSSERDLGEFWSDTEFELKPASEVEFD
jgi:hypothetical protein